MILPARATGGHRIVARYLRPATDGGREGGAAGAIRSLRMIRAAGEEPMAVVSVEEPLSSWRDGPATAATVAFVHAVTTAGVEQPTDDGPGKPVHIWARTGRKPLLAGGTADGDVGMLESARFALQLHHDDEDREFACEDGAEKALAAAGARGWTVVSMKRDFREVF